MRKQWARGALLSLSVLSLPAAVAPIAIPLSNFSGLETVVDFNTLGFEEEVTTNSRRVACLITSTRSS